MSALAATGAFVGLFHTLAGPDHYVPFVAMARSGRWSVKRTLAVTLACGLAHVGSSLALASLAVALGWNLATVDSVERTRGDLAAWLFIGLGLAYMVWGIRRALRGRPHTHWHVHEDGTAHRKEHAHLRSHASIRTAEFAPDLAAPGSVVGPWALFLLFVLGPCEPLIPLLMYPAAQRSWSGVATVTASFAGATLAAMAITVLCGFYGLAWRSFGSLERYDHALAGLALFVCGVAIRLGM